MNRVIVDTDFLNHILQASSGEEILKKIIDFFDFQFLIHPWTYDREIKNISTATQKFVEQYATILDYNDFITNEGEEKMYDFHFHSLFNEMNFKQLSLGKQTFRTYNKSGENLGEIHSVLLSLFLNIPVLLSDDYNAREIAAKRINMQGYCLNVKTSFDIMCEMIKTDKKILSIEEAVSVIRNYNQKRQKDNIKTIKGLYK